MKILYIYLFQGLGDAVLLLPILAGFQANNPDVDLGVLVRNRTAEVISRSIFRGHVHILDEILVSQEFTNLTEPLAPPKRRSRREVYLAYRAIQNELNEVQYDIAVDATYKMGINSQRLLKCSGANSLYGWVKTEQEAKRRCLSGWIVDNRFDGSMHWVQYCCKPLELVKPFSPLFDNSLKSCPLTHQTESKCKVVVIPGSTDTLKRWPSECFAHVINELIEKFNISVTFLVTEEETSLIEKLVLAINVDTEFAVEVSFQSMVDIISNATLVLTNDTGPMHVAFLLDVPTVAIYRSRYDAVTTVWGTFPKNRSAILFKEICHTDSMTSTKISATDVYLASERIVKSAFNIP